MQAQAKARAQAQDWGNQGAEGQDKTRQVGTRILENGGLREDGPHSFYDSSNFQLAPGGLGGSVGVLLYQFQLQGTRSSGWIAPRSRSRRSPLGTVPGPVPVSVPVPGDAAGCRRQDMGVPPTTGLAMAAASQPRAAAADRWLQKQMEQMGGGTCFVIRSAAHVGVDVGKGGLLCIFGTKRCARSVTLAGDLYSSNVHVGDGLWLMACGPWVGKEMMGVEAD
ncbi:hypothetical protein F4782DRAFT_529090 [Xylaria castorea]|nr:hypothetical protein F4782DRAFT_529090 [Xylaria castorea]